MSVEPIRWLDLPQGIRPPGINPPAAPKNTHAEAVASSLLQPVGLAAWADAVVDDLLDTGYPHEFLAAGFFCRSPLAALAGAGFLLMSQDMGGIPILLPKLHLERAVLDPCDFRVPKGLRGKLDAGKTGLTLHVSNNIGEAFDICVERWGADWLTPALKEALEGFP